MTLSTAVLHFDAFSPRIRRCEQQSGVPPHG
jgi:hypothetical protein